MGLIKKILFMFIPIATILIAVSYGLSIILGTQGVTYLTTNETGMTIFDFNTYLLNLTANNLQTPFINLAKATTIIVDPVEQIKYQFANLSLQNFFKALGNIGLLIVNALIFVIDLVISIFQVLIIILSKMLNIFGINTSANIPLFNAFRNITNFTIITGWVIV